MSIRGLGHFTIRCTPRMLPGLRTFYANVLGLADGARPEFPFPGHWFYCGEKPIVHLAAMDSRDAVSPTGPFDHVAFEADDIEGVRERLLVAGIPFFERPIPGYPLQQLFARDPAGIKVEQTFATPGVAPVDESHVCVNGIRLALKVTGTGPALLLLHGGAGSLRMFDCLVPWLSDRYRVIRYDQRDCGASEASARHYDFSTLADDAAAVLEALDAPKAHVFGTSFGGLLAQALALRHPGSVDKLILSSTWQLGLPFPEMNPRRASVPPGDRTPEKLAQAFFSHHFLQSHADAADFFKASEAGMSEARAALLKEASPTRAGSIKANTLIIGGEDDRIVPFDRSRELGRSIPDAQIAEPLPQVGHVGVVEAPEKLAHLIHAFCK